MAYLAAAAVPHGEYELGCAKHMGRVLVLLRGGMGLWRKKDWSVIAELYKSGLSGG
jgi:hypothetical protein